MIASRLTPALAILAALLVAAVALVVVELGKGGAGTSSAGVANPCRSRPPFPGAGIDATIQRIVLDGLDGAACGLHTTREELVLSLPQRRRQPDTIEAAVRAGLLRAVDRAERRGDLPGFLAPLVRGIVEHAPLGELIRGSIRLRA